MIFRRKQIQEESTRTRRKEQEENTEWDLRKIAIFLLVFTIIILVSLEVKRNFFPNTKILGASTYKQIQKPNITPPHISSSQFSSSLQDIKKNIQSINAVEVATSSPQIQKVLRDIQGIKDLPASQARDMCLKICSGI